MRRNRYIKVIIMAILSIFLFFCLIMINNNSYASYGEEFKTFLVKNDDGTLKNGKTTATDDFDNTYEIPFALNFSAIDEYINNNCKDKKGKIDNSKIDSEFKKYCSNRLDVEKYSEAQSDEEQKNYDNLFGIIGLVNTAVQNRRIDSNESIEDVLKRKNIYSEFYNDDGSVNTSDSSNALPTKEELLNYNYTNIYNCLNNKKEVKNEDGKVVGIKDVENMYWDGKNKACRIIDDNSNLSDADKKEIKNKWAKVYCDSKGSNANVEEYLKTEISSYKAEKYYRDPNVTTSTTDAGVDDVISDGDSFIGLGKEDRIDVSNLRTFSRNIYNILLTIGIAVAVISGSIIGIKYMLGSVEEKADIKSLLIPYIAGCVIIFGSFAIWKLVVTILQGV